jgi:hypothetical protein
VNQLPAESDTVEALIESLRLSVAGVETQRERHAYLSNHLAATAFSTGSTRSTVDVGAGLWAVLRTSADRRGRVLCVHNVSDEPQGFLPVRQFGEQGDAAASLVFLTGETTTEEVAGGLRCELKPLGFVWLGNFTSHPGENTR